MEYAGSFPRRLFAQAGGKLSVLPLGGSRTERFARGGEIGTGNRTFVRYFRRFPVPPAGCRRCLPRIAAGQRPMPARAPAETVRKSPKSCPYLSPRQDSHRRARGGCGGGARFMRTPPRHRGGFLRRLGAQRRPQLLQKVEAKLGPRRGLRARLRHRCFAQVGRSACGHRCVEAKPDSLRHLSARPAAVAARTMINHKTRRTGRFSSPREIRTCGAAGFGVDGWGYYRSAPRHSRLRRM